MAARFSPWLVRSFFLFSLFRFVVSLVSVPLDFSRSRDLFEEPRESFDASTYDGREFLFGGRTIPVKNCSRNGGCNPRDFYSVPFCFAHASTYWPMYVYVLYAFASVFFGSSSAGRNRASAVIAKVLLLCTRTSTCVSQNSIFTYTVDREIQYSADTIIAL